MPIPFDLLSFKSGWHNRRKLVVSAYTSSANDKLLSKLIQQLMNKHVFNVINKCISNKQIWSVRNDVEYCLFNTIFSLMFGFDKPLSPTDSNLINLIDLIKKYFDALLASNAVSMLFPNNKLMSNIIINLTKMPMIANKLCEIFDIWIDKYNSKNGDMDHKRDTYFGLLKKEIDEGRMTLYEAKGDMISPYLGGIHAPSVTLELIILYMAKLGILYQNEILQEIQLICDKKEFSDESERCLYIYYNIIENLI